LRKPIREAGGPSRAVRIPHIAVIFAMRDLGLADDPPIMPRTNGAIIDGRLSRCDLIRWTISVPNW